MASRKPLEYPVFQAFDSNGNPLSSGTVTFYDAGTTDKRDTYSDVGLTTANPNPVTLNSRGEPESGGGTAINIYLDNQPYKIVLKDSSGSTIRTVDDYRVSDLTSPSTSSDPALAFDTWRTPSASRPTLVTLTVTAQTDGTTNAIVFIEVDESGGTLADYRFETRVSSDHSANAEIRQATSVLVPAGGQYRINNFSDPNTANSIGDHREFTL